MMRSRTVGALCLFLSLCRIKCQTEERLIIECIPDDFQNDISWTLEKLYANGSADILDEGSGISGDLKTMSPLMVKDTDCLRYNLTDSWGDGICCNSPNNGRIDVYFGDNSVDNGETTEMFDGRAWSDYYIETGKGGDGSGSASYLIEGGIKPYGGCSILPTGCHENTAVDVIFVLDTSADLTYDCQNIYFPAIIDLVEDHLPRDDLKMAIITFGTDADDDTVLRMSMNDAPTSTTVSSSDLKSIGFSSGGSWQGKYKDAIKSFGETECIGGGHSTIDAIHHAADIFVEVYGDSYDLTRQQYIVVMTTDDIDNSQTKSYSCSYNQQVLEANSINMVLISEITDGTPNAVLECLAGYKEDNIISMEYFAKIADDYDAIENALCSPIPKVAITEVFIDDDQNAYWVELVNLGFAFTVSSLDFTGNLFSGNVDNDTIIEQGDIFVIGNMGTGDTSDDVCTEYFSSVSASNPSDCTNYFAVTYDGSASLNQFEINGLSVSPSDGFYIESGYSYQLEVIYSDSTNISNFRESCYRYGSPGTANVDYCAIICDETKCQSNGDSASACNTTSGCSTLNGNTFCANAQCSCSTNYYYDVDDTRSCLAVDPPSDCLAYILDEVKGNISVNWSASAFEGVESYSIYYGTSSELTGLSYEDDQGVMIVDPLLSGGEVQMVAVGTDATDGSSKTSLSISCDWEFAPTKPPTMTGETYAPSRSPTPAPVTTAPPTTEPTLAPTFAGCGSSLLLDLMFILDSSGSVYDNGYDNWQAEIDFAKAIVNNSLPGDSKVGLINFSGCGSNKNFDSCRANGKLKKMWGLNDFGSPNDQEAVYDRINQIDSTDFNGGYTWTNEALTLALTEFQGNSTDNRKKMIILLTDGEPYPHNANPPHEPCITSTGYESDTLTELKALDTLILAVGIAVNDAKVSEYLACILEDFDAHFFGASDFDALSSFVDDISSIVCSDDIQLVINEVGLIPNVSGSADGLYFIELYNPSVGVSLNGFEFTGLISYTVQDAGYGVNQGQYWVMSTYDMDTLNQTECRNCSQDLLVNESYADTSMDNDYWKVEIYDGAGELVDSVERNPIYFPNVNSLYTHELQYEDYDNSLGGNWEESCYEYGTPQDPNQEDCPCNLLKCIEKGDKVAYCGDITDSGGSTTTGCVCSANYILSGGVCIPLFPPDCCYSFVDTDCSSTNQIILTWCSPQTSSVVSYYIYQDGVFLESVASSITEHIITGSNNGICTSNFTVTTVFQTSPLVESAKQTCDISDPTPTPTVGPTQFPTEPTHEPTPNPTFPSPTKEPTSEPSFAPTAFCCNAIVISHNSSQYSDAIIDLQGNYYVVSNSSALDRWNWKKDLLSTTETGIYYDTDNERWRITTQFADLIQANNASSGNSRIPPYVQDVDSTEYSLWYSINTDEIVSSVLWCTCDPPFQTPHPTPAPIPDPPTPYPYPNCSQLTVSSTSNPSNRDSLSNVELVLDDPPLSDGKGIWVSTDDDYIISWYDVNQRWTFYDVDNDELYLGATSLSPLSDPIGSESWTYIGSRAIVYELDIECDNPPTTPATPSPTTYSDPCEFPDSIVHNWDMDRLESWDSCYYATYSDGTTTSDLESQCLGTISDQFNGTLDDIYIFVGAVEKSNTDVAYIGAYAHISVLQTPTTSTTRAKQTSTETPKETYWYFVDGTAFGFSDVERINLANGGCDVYDLTSDNRLCWHLVNSQTGGYRAGTNIALNFDRTTYKVLYYKNCSNPETIATPAPTLGECATIDVNSTEYGSVSLNDYDVVNDFKGSWQDEMPPNNDFELGWLGAESSWLFETNDSKIWFYVDDPDSILPPFDFTSTWFNRDNSSETTNFYMTCDPAYNGSVVTDPPDSTCECVEVSTVGLSAIDGVYKLANDALNAGASYYRPKDNMRLYYDTNLESWLFVGSGAHFEADLSGVTEGSNPTQIPPLDAAIPFTDRDQIQLPAVDVTFSCPGTCTYDNSTCLKYDQWDYVDGEFEFTSNQMGFPENITENEQIDGTTNWEEFERKFDEFFYSKAGEDAVIQLTISDYVVDGNTTFERTIYPPVRMEMVYDSLHRIVYSDSNSVGVWFQLFDEYDSTFVDVSNMTLQIYAQCGACFTTLLPSTLCDLGDDFDDEGGFNLVKCELTDIDISFFGDDNDTLTITGELTDSSDNLVNQTSIELTLAPLVEAEGIQYPGIYGEFAMSPRYPGEEVTLDLMMNSDELFRTHYQERYVQSWWLSITFDADVIQYVEFNPDDTIWGSIRSLYTVDESNDVGKIEIWGSKIGQLRNTNGANITVGSFSFVVVDDLTDGFYHDVLSFVTLSMSGDNGYSIANDVVGLMADINGWNTSSASLQCLPDEPLGVFVEVNTNHLWNTAFIAGGASKVTLDFPINVVYHSNITDTTTLVCSRDSSISNIMFSPSSNPTGSYCTAIARAAQFESGVVQMSIIADGFETNQTINVWHPNNDSFSIVPWNTGNKTMQTKLNLVDMPYRAVGDYYYESLPLYVYCSFSLGDVATSQQVMVNEFVDGFDVEDESIAEIVQYSSTNSRFLIRGVGTGTTNVSLSSLQGLLDSVEIEVGSEVVGIEGLGGVLVTHAEFNQDSQSIDLEDDSLAHGLVFAKLVQQLSAAGDIGSVHPFMKLADGVLIDLTDDPNIVYTSTAPNSLQIVEVDKSNGQNMEEPGAYVIVQEGAEDFAWTSLVEYSWMVPNMTDDNDRLRGIGCIYGELNGTTPRSVNVSLSCNTTLITRADDPADYIFGLPVECSLIVEVYWSDGSMTDLSTDQRTNYTVLGNLLVVNANTVTVNTSCDISTEFTAQNTDCYGSQTVKVTFNNFDALDGWSGQIDIEVVVFDRLKLMAFPYPKYDSVYEDATTLNLFECVDEYQMSELQITGNLTDGREKDLTARSDVILIESTDSNALSLNSDDRLVKGLGTGSANIFAVLNGSHTDSNRDDYTSNTVAFTVTDVNSTIDSIELYTFGDRGQVFEDIIDSNELLKINVTFSDGLVIPDILSEIASNTLWNGTAISSVFNFSSTDPSVVAVSENGNLTLLDNWWRAVNITASTVCGTSTISTSESIYPNLKPDSWDVDIEAPSTDSGLQFSNMDSDGGDSFLWNIYINATDGTLLSFSLRIWWDDGLFIENGTDDCSYFENGDRDSWPQCEAAGDWEGQMLSWNMDTVRGELRLAGASSTGSSTNSSLQHVATCNFRVNSDESDISQVVGRVIEITYIDDDDSTIKHVYDEPIVSGKGYQQINEGDSVNLALPTNIQTRIDTELSIQYGCTAATNDEYIFSSNVASSSGCCDEAVFGDVNLDCRQTAFDSQATSLYLIDTDSQSPYTMIDLEELAHSQRIAVDQSLDYLQDDNNECSDPLQSNPCPNGLEDVWYGLQVSTGKFLYLNVSDRTDTLVQDGNQVKGFAPMFIQEYSNLFRFANASDATVFFELKNVNSTNEAFFIGNGSLLKGEVVTTHQLNSSILIRGEYVDDQYWTFETNEFDWTNDDCFEMAILYETYDESSNCTQIDREYAFRGTNYYGDSFSEFTELCVRRQTNEPTASPTESPTSAPTNEDRGPELMDCRFEDHGTAILAYFSEDTNRAGFGGKPFSCLSVWNPVSFNNIEGSSGDSRCLWKDFRTMRIELGYDFSVRPSFGDVSYYLELVGSNIRDYDEFSPPTKGYCKVYPMFNPPPVFANIIGANQLSPCDDLRLSGTPTSGQAAPMTWKWTVGGVLADGCDIGSDEIPDDQNELFISYECLVTDRDNELNIGLTATNHYLANFSYLASTDETDVVISISSEKEVPSVQLLAPLIVNMTAEQDLIVPSFVRVYRGEGCDDPLYDLDAFDFEWSSVAYEDIISDSDSPFGLIRGDTIDVMMMNHTFDIPNEITINGKSPTLVVPGGKLRVGQYYVFKLAVTYIASNLTNYGFVGVIVNQPTPYPKPSVMYTTIEEGSNLTLSAADFYDFYFQDSSSYGIEWNCFTANTTDSILSDPTAFDNESAIVINEDNAELEVGGVYNCSVHLYSTQTNTEGMTWGRDESYFVFEYVSVDQNETDKMISVLLTTNIGTINRNKRVVVSASFEDMIADISTADNGLEFDNYTFEWTNLAENSDLTDDVYGISVIDHIDYERGFTVNYVIDDEVSDFIYDGQIYGFELLVTAPDGSYSGYGRIEFSANRGPNGGECSVELVDSAESLYRVDCYGFTDEYMEIPLQYNFMLLNQCETDVECEDELICDTESSEYGVGFCKLSTVGTVQNYLREWTNGNFHYFRAQCDSGESYILRSFIRDYTGFVTSFDTPFDAGTSSDGATVITEYLTDLNYVANLADLSSFAQFSNAFDTVMDCEGGYDRSPLVDNMQTLYKDSLFNVDQLNVDDKQLQDRFSDALKTFSTVMDQVFFDDEQFDPTTLSSLTSSGDNIANVTFSIVSDMIEYFIARNDDEVPVMIPRDLSVFQLAAMTWAGDAALQQSDLEDQVVEFTTLKNEYNAAVLSINELGLNERLIDETHYNVSYNGLQVLSGWETEDKLFSDDSDCGGDLVDLAPDYETAFFGGVDVAYVKCVLVAFNGGVLEPTAVSESMSSPIIYWNLRGFLKDGSEVQAGDVTSRRRMIEFDSCSPFLYTVPHNPNTSLISYTDRRSLTADQPYITWSVCKNILSSTIVSDDIDFDDAQAPTAEDCYVLTHDEEKTVCACNSNYTLLAVEEELYYPNFLATLKRENPPFTWTGLVDSVAAVLILLVLFFCFAFAFYILPSYDKHKALLAVKKGLPKSQREGAYYQTAEGRVYRAARTNINNLSFCAVYGEVLKIRLRNDHLCLWWMCDDPGSNISHFIKVLMSFMYVLLFMFQIAWFYGNELETVFPDTLFAFLIAFETMLPIWICAWCISKVRPHEFTDDEIDEMVEDQMAIITKNQRWEDEYESDIEHGSDAEYEENDGGVFAPPEIVEPLPNDMDNSIAMRVYTDIDEEVEYLEEHYMPDEAVWDRKKRKIYPLSKMGYEETGDESESSVDSVEDRLGFEDMAYKSHMLQARAAEKLGFIPVNEEEEFDEQTYKMLDEQRKEVIKKKKRKQGREASVSSRISSIFKGGGSTSKQKKKDKERRGSKLLSLLSQGSKDREVSDLPSPTDESGDMDSHKFQQFSQDDGPSNDEEVLYDEDGVEQDDEYYDEDEEEETSSQRRRRERKERKRKKPAVASMNAPRPMQDSVERKRRKKPKKRNRDDADAAEIELERRKPKSKKKGQYSKSEERAGSLLAAHLSAHRKYTQFNNVLQIGRVNRENIAKNSKLLQRIVDNAVANGDTSFAGSKHIVRRTNKLIRAGHPLFNEIESGATDENQKRIQKMLRKQDVINTVFSNLDGNAVNGISAIGLRYSPAELRALEELPEEAPSQRPPREKETRLEEEGDLWADSHLEQDTIVVRKEDQTLRVENRKCINMDDIWDVTGALPPDMLSKFEDAYDPWKEDEMKPVQKPLRDDEEEEYREKLKSHFKQRRNLLKRKYWLPRWCRYVVWSFLLIFIVLLMVGFLNEGNKLGAQFLWIPEEFNSTNCTISISEQTRFDYDYSLDEAARRNPACSPDEIFGSMPHCWDYRVRFTIASGLSLLTSILIVQPLYIAILALIVVTCLPMCAPCCVSMRNALCGLSKDDPGYKQFIGGTILISGDHVLEYGQLADDTTDDPEMTMISAMSRDPREEGSSHGDSKTAPLLG